MVLAVIGLSVLVLVLVAVLLCHLVEQRCILRGMDDRLAELLRRLPEPPAAIPDEGGCGMWD